MNQANRLPVFLCCHLPECSVNEDSFSIPATCLGQRRRKVEWGQCTNGLSDGALCSLPSVLAILRVFSGSCGNLVGGRGYPPDTCSRGHLFFALTEEVCLRAPQADHLWATISVLLLVGALLTVIGIRPSMDSADHTGPQRGP